jgi:DNA polymerase-3 subunit gamma/tau
MTQILESAPYKLDSTRYKVLMIDEVHMLTNHAFNAMLKTLEEPPEHVKFILATTDPQKIPVTVLSRCLQFNLKQMPQPQIVGHLEEVLKAENIEAERQGLRLIAASASGSMRDALSLTDQAIAYSAGPVTEEAVRGMLGAIDMSYLIRVLDALVAGDAATLLAVADEMLGRSLSFGGALTELAALLARIAVAQASPQAIADDAPEREDILRLAGKFSPEEVQLHYQIVIHGKNDLPQAPDEVTGFTMTLLRMLAFRPEEGGGARAAAPRMAASPARETASAASVPAAPASRPAPQGAPAAAAAPAPTPASAAPVPAAHAAPPESGATGSFDGDWPSLIARLPLTGFVRAWANKSEFKNLSNGQFDLVVGTQKLADDKPMQEKLRSAIEQYLGRPTRLNVTVGEMAGQSVSAITERQNDERQRAAEASIMGDPFVKEMMEKVGTRPTNVRPV